MEVAGDQPDDDGAASPALTAEPLELEDGARCFCKPSRLFATFGAFRSHCAAKHAGLPLRPVRADGGAVPLAAYATRERLNALKRAKKKSPTPRDPSALREACETIDWEKRGARGATPRTRPAATRATTTSAGRSRATASASSSRRAGTSSRRTTS